MSFEPTKIGTIKAGKYVIHEDSGEVCKVVNVDHSKPGKHGAAKARMVMVGLFDGRKRELVSSVDKRIKVPLITKFDATVTNVDSTLHLMHSETFEQIEVNLPEEEELKTNLMSMWEEGKGISCEIWNVMGKYKVNNVREE